MSSTPETMHFADRLIGRLRELGHPLCVGLDPHLDRIPELFRRGSMDPLDPRTADAVGVFCEAILDRLEGRVAIIKPQIAFFERLGWRGLRVLGEIVAKARRLDLLTLLDAKRGDIGSTAEGYAAAYLGRQSEICADAITVSPYLGRDTLEPFLARVRRHGRGLFVLVKTSNPGSGDYQNRLLSDGRRLFEEVAGSLAETAAELRGPATGWSSLGIVAGATWPQESERVRELLPHALFLVPGYGAQGSKAGDAVRGFGVGPCGRLEGGLVNSSRAVLFPDGGRTREAARWEHAVDEALDRSIEELSSVIGS